MTSRTVEHTHTKRDVMRAMMHPAVIVGALGYFVDVYDLILFAVVRVASLKGLGFSGDELVTHGTWLINWQNGGMLLGGVIWGLLGDRVGRIKVLFGSIILYSLANIVNGFVHTLEAYTICRFLAGLGLAGELGGCITLVTEVLPRALRGYGTLMVSGVGVLGAVAAAYVGLNYDWRTAYFIGGGLGLLLLFLRMCVAESGMFAQMKEVNRPAFGSQIVLLFAPKRIGRYLCCILIGLPTWYIIGLLFLFSPEFAKAMGATGDIKAPITIAVGYSGVCFGSLGTGFISQWLRSRKIVLAIFLVVNFVLINTFYLSRGPSIEFLYTLIFFIGVCIGYWALFVTVAAEHFGTNMRATVATTVPNFSRGSVIPVTMLFASLKPVLAAHFGAPLGLLYSGLALGWLVTVLAVLGLFGLRETFHDDLDFLET